MRDTMRAATGRALLMALAGLALGVGGCNDVESEAARSLREASDQVRTVDAFGFEASPGVVEASISDASSRLSGSPSGLEAERGAVSSLSSSVTTAGAEGDLLLASDGLVKARRASTELVALADAFSRLMSRAAALEATDDSESRDRVRNTIAERRAELQDLTGRRESLSREVGSMDAEIAEKREAAAGFRSQAGELRLRAGQGTAAEAAELAPRIREFLRQADAEERAAASVAVRAEQRRADLGAVEAQVARANRQIESLNAETGKLDERRRQLADQAVQLRAEGARIEQQIAEAVESLRNELQSGVIEPSQRASESLASAVQSASIGRSAGVEAGTVAEAVAQRRLGETWTMIGEAHGVLLRSLEMLSDMAPAPGRASEYARATEASRSAANEARASAAEAYGEAADAYRALARGEAAAEFERVADTLERAAERVGNGG